MNIRCAVIDDEPLARQVVKDYISKIPWLELVLESDDALSAIQLLKRTSVDLLFLDIKMPGFTGIQFLEVLKNRPHVIITTAYREFAVEGFELEVLDYLLKPFSFERFLQGVNKVIHLEAKQNDPDTNKTILIKVDKTLINLPIQDIIYIQAYKDYIKVFTAERLYITYNTITSITEQLSQDMFSRVHRSYTINIHHLKAVEGNRAILSNKEQVPLGRHYKSAFINRINQSKN